MAKQKECLIGFDPNDGTFVEINDTTVLVRDAIELTAAGVPDTHDEDCEELNTTFQTKWTAEEWDSLCQAADRLNVSHVMLFRRVMRAVGYLENPDA